MRGRGRSGNRRRARSSARSSSSSSSAGAGAQARAQGLRVQEARRPSAGLDRHLRAGLPPGPAVESAGELLFFRVFLVVGVAAAVWFSDVKRRREAARRRRRFAALFLRRLRRPCREGGAERGALFSRGGLVGGREGDAFVACERDERVVEAGKLEGEEEEEEEGGEEEEVEGREKGERNGIGSLSLSGNPRSNCSCFYSHLTHVSDGRRPVSQGLGGALHERSGELGERRRGGWLLLGMDENRGGEENDNGEQSLSSSPRPHVAS